jgi:hypothetical protein
MVRDEIVLRMKNLQEIHTHNLARTTFLISSSQRCRASDPVYFRAGCQPEMWGYHDLRQPYFDHGIGHLAQLSRTWNPNTHLIF